ncbi:MAG TPA: helix-turn-helix transcriptional regulator [Flavisolibacter sp.]|nr:helix-turn-helix transcriptional regulator [Flavisolibacter sp.]
MINAVKEMRLAAGITQIELSRRLGKSDSFIGHMETHKRRSKYNISHLNMLAIVFNCSPRDFLPKDPL